MGWMHDTLEYMSQDPVHRRWHHDKMTFGLLYAFSENFVLPLSHDEVVHGKGSILDRMPGDACRSSPISAPITDSCGAHPARSCCSWARNSARAEWNFDQSLDWHLMDIAWHRGVRQLVTDLNTLYRATPALYQRDCQPNGFQWVNATDHENSVFSWLRYGEDGTAPVLVVSNFTPVPRHGYQLGLPMGGQWIERMNTDAEIYGGSGTGNLGGVYAEEDGQPWPAVLRQVHDTAAVDPVFLARIGGLEFMSSHKNDISWEAYDHGSTARIWRVIASGAHRHGVCARRRSRPRVWSSSPTGAPSPRSISAASPASSISRCPSALNSGIRHIAVATQYRAHSLIRHLQRGWNFLRPERNEGFDILPASQSISETRWYLGTADAVYQNLDIIEAYGPEYLIVLAGDHIYKQDYGVMLQHHVDSGADVIVGCIEVPRMDATGFGVMHVDDKWQISQFLEKPKDPPAMPDNPDKALASMGIYVFRTAFLADLLRRDAADPNSAHDFGKDIIPYIVKNGESDRPFLPPLLRQVGQGIGILLARCRHRRPRIGKRIST